MNFLVLYKLILYFIFYFYFFNKISNFNYLFYKYDYKYINFNKLNKLNKSNIFKKNKFININKNNYIYKNKYNCFVYKVLPGDTLNNISNKIGLNYKYLAKINNLDPPYKIKVGSILRIYKNNLNLHSFLKI